MKNEYVNRIAKVAQEKFDEAKNLILQEMQVALDKADRCGSDDSVAKIISDFMNQTLGMSDCDCCCDCDCECECPENMADLLDEEGIAWINEDAIDFDEDYREIGILMQKDADGELKIAMEYDEEINVNELPALLSKAIVETIYSDEAISDVLDKKDVDNEIGTAMAKAIVKLAFLGIDKVLDEKGGEGE